MKIFERILIVSIICASILMAGCKMKGGQLIQYEDAEPASVVADSTLGEATAIPSSEIAPPPADCTAGQTRACGISRGACQEGVQSCVDGHWGECTGSVDPAHEVCDEIDNNCDGAVDEGCDCTDGENMECGPDTTRLPCKKGTQVCTNGSWGQCLNAIYPQSEICDTIDNDCDGLTDAADPDLPKKPLTFSYGICAGHFQQCKNGSWDENYFLIPGFVIDETNANCNELDDDCDNEVDEMCQCNPGDVEDCPGTTVGECNPGTRTCGDDHLWGDCDGAVEATDEVCNGKDDNCDGTKDEGVTTTLSPEKTEGVCACIEMKCDIDQGKWIEFPQRTTLGDYVIEENGALDPSRCDGLDNDCDGEVDELCACKQDDDPVQCGSDVGECVSGVQMCVFGLGQLSGCMGSVGSSPEICNGLDDDCNGAADDMEKPDANLTSCGVCAPITLKKTCGQNALGVWGWLEPDYVALVPNFQVTETLCDGLDNDCDCDVDDDCQCTLGEEAVCGTDEGECVSGIKKCDINGNWGPCEGEVGPDEFEQCDGIVDGDCDGKDDHQDGCECVKDETAVCGSDVGECVSGYIACDPNTGGWIEGICNGEVEPTVEVCNGKDDDCDGFVDEKDSGELLTQDCKTDCGFGTETCKGGKWVECDAVEPQAEVCDGKDTNCDGDFDEDCPCVDGEEGSCGDYEEIGLCVRGKQTCDINGQWGDCVGGTGPQAEICDGKDNDCDDKIDEGLLESAAPLAGNPKDRKGVCADVRQICVGGKYMDPDSTTIDGYQIMETKCDGLDNDCDGIADGMVRDCPANSCVGSISTCTFGVWGACSILPSPEICDGLDNDCDGDVDENLPESAAPLAAKQRGVCGGSRKICVNGAYAEPDYTTIDGYEADETSCDGKNNDCDASFDEGCRCIDGQIDVCGSAIGECSYGEQTCDIDGEWGECVGDKGPSEEVCDGKDNDCDLTVDGFSKTCKNSCDVVGQKYCWAGHWDNCSAPDPIEVCNGIDDDCDGILDEQDEDLTQECSTACGVGYRTCENLVLKGGYFMGDCVRDCVCKFEGGMTTGTQICAGDDWGACSCSGDVECTPKDEVCNGMDDDCDGDIDEGLDWQPNPNCPDESDTVYIKCYKGQILYEGECPPEITTCTEGDKQPNPLCPDKFPDVHMLCRDGMWKNIGNCQIGNSGSVLTTPGLVPYTVDGN